MRFFGGLWDQDQLDQLYANCMTHLHGHSVGRTNPSLLRAIGAGAATIAYDVSFNREVLQSRGRYFLTPDDVAAAVTEAEGDPAGIRREGKRARLMAARYDWDRVADGYEQLCRRLAARDVPRSRPSGRRLRPASAAQPTGAGEELVASVQVLAEPRRSAGLDAARTHGRLRAAGRPSTPVDATPVQSETPSTRAAGA